MLAPAIYFRGGKLSVDKKMSRKDQVNSYQEKQTFFEREFSLGEKTFEQVCDDRFLGIVVTSSGLLPFATQARCERELDMTSHATSPLQAVKRNGHLLFHFGIPK